MEISLPRKKQFLDGNSKNEVRHYLGSEYPQSFAAQFLDYTQKLEIKTNAPETNIYVFRYFSRSESKTDQKVLFRVPARKEYLDTLRAGNIPLFTEKDLLLVREKRNLFPQKTLLIVKPDQYWKTEFSKKEQESLRYEYHIYHKNQELLFLQRDRFPTSISYLQAVPYLTPEARKKVDDLESLRKQWLREDGGRPRIQKKLLPSIWFNEPLPLHSHWNWGFIQNPDTPLLMQHLEPGSYLFVLNAPGYQTLKVPLYIERPDPEQYEKEKEQDLQFPVLTFSWSLLSKKEKDPDFVYIPECRFLYGDPGSAGSGFQEEKKAGPFFIKKYEVTFGEYAEFLQELCEQESTEEAQFHLPRTFGADQQENVPFLLLKAGKVAPNLPLIDQYWPEKITAENWKKTALGGVSYQDAKAYLKWLNEKDSSSRVFRLLHETEWELASRGADGRTFGWGNHFQVGITKLLQGYGSVDVQKNNRMLEMGRLQDRSVFGVMDMGGSMGEWTEGFFEESQKANPPKQKEDILRVIRGNAWALTPEGLECAFRTNGPANYFHPSIGFRYGYSLEEKK